MNDLTDDAGGGENLIADNPSGEENLTFDDAGGAQFQMPADRTVNYTFPVEVVVVGVLTEDDYREICKCVWTDFGEAWARQSA